MPCRHTSTGARSAVKRSNMPSILLNMKLLIRLVRSAEAKRFSTYPRHLLRKRPERAELCLPGNGKIRDGSAVRTTLLWQGERQQLSDQSLPPTRWSLSFCRFLSAVQVEVQECGSDARLADNDSTASTVSRTSVATRSAAGMALDRRTPCPAHCAANSRVPCACAAASSALPATKANGKSGMGGQAESCSSFVN